ncbi:hypothetical protein LJ656_18425 [Paraburkholderia sp. MMS20-SJTR3]|uniref:Lipoprotein n=1 Tax=Paraburkholderia sejongensis TaxID=2886946 RepID=A0ABS8JXE7_9BURK|nr:hypothetical protein [Paraburkholderia sp. MMS20-SJTR3]MCC8394570.1 hypothetical protein [Paraburkholderia sp. MMS20-SJTR3]
MTYSRFAAFALTLGGLCGSAAAVAAVPALPAHCAPADALEIRGDVPAAISFDVYQQLRPLSARRIALFQAAGEVKPLRDGQPVCQITDDGVDDPSAVLVRLPRGANAWWVSAANVQAAD